MRRGWSTWPTRLPMAIPASAGGVAGPHGCCRCCPLKCSKLCSKRSPRGQRKQQVSGADSTVSRHFWLGHVTRNLSLTAVARVQIPYAYLHETPASAGFLLFAGSAGLATGTEKAPRHARCPGAVPKNNSASRSPFGPLPQVTFPLPVEPLGEASTYWGPVLAARRTVPGSGRRLQRVGRWSGRKNVLRADFRDPCPAQPSSGA